MLRTITMGTCVSVQGIFVKSLPGGRVIIRVGEQLFSGKPIAKTA